MSAAKKGVLRVGAGTIIGMTTGVTLGVAAGATGAAILGNSIVEVVKMKAAGGTIVGGLTGLIMAVGIHAYYRERPSTPVETVMGSGPGTAGPIPFVFFVFVMTAALDSISDMIGYAIFMHSSSLSFSTGMQTMAVGTAIFVIPIAIITCVILACGKNGLEHWFDSITRDK